MPVMCNDDRNNHAIIVSITPLFFCRQTRSELTTNAKIECTYDYDYMMILAETLTLITLLAPKAVFHRLQTACRAFKLRSAQQFMVRCRERKLLTHISANYKSYYNILPHGGAEGKRDGAYIRIYHSVSEYGDCLMDHYVNGTQHGTFRSWYPSGQLYLQYTKVAGRVQGVYYSWYPSGQLCKQCTYVDGKLCGEYCKWYESGQLHKQYMCDMGVQDGECLAWREFGPLYKHRVYSNGKLMKRIM